MSDPLENTLGQKLFSESTTQTNWSWTGSFPPGVTSEKSRNRDGVPGGFPLLEGTEGGQSDLC